MSPAQSQSARQKSWPARRPPTTAAGTPYGIPASLVLHGLAVIALLFAFRGVVPPGEANMVPVDLITIAEETNVAAAAPPEPQQETIERPPLEPMAAPPEPEIAEPAPIDVKPPEIKIAEPPPKPQRENNDINALLNQLTKPEPRNARPAPRAQETVGAGNAATAGLADALRNAIGACWNPIPGAPNPADQIVTFTLQLNRDGTVARVEAQTRGGNSYTAAARLAAERAIYGCQPYNTLPANRYNEWRDFTLRFDPRQMQ
ncbi:MAG TPA: hypothetical protein VJ798_13300 [Rhizomicrobium sp.]|nr:hypothetical protein [Rhizomicrobium sp.]